MQPPVEEMEVEGACAVLEPLSFPGPSSKLSETKYAPWEISTCRCSICDTTFQCPQDINAIWSHMMNKHSVSIGSIERVACLKDYLDYWRTKFQEKPISQYGSIFLSDGRQYNRLNTCSEDNEIRNRLLKKRLELKIELTSSSGITPVFRVLRDCWQNVWSQIQTRLGVIPEEEGSSILVHPGKEWILDCQTEEREDKTFSRRCFFCRHVEKGSRYKYVTHLSYHHNFQLGKPENLVFIDKLLDKVEESLNRLECIYCGHIFKERSILKEHMRKKFHKRINPHSKDYDPYYIVYYLQDHQRKYWTRKRAECPYEINTLWSEWCEEGSDWSEWCEEPLPIICLFCTEFYFSWDDIMGHMLSEHGFNYKLLTDQYNFYEQVKIVNFIRREMYQSECYNCKMKFHYHYELLNHMTNEKHFTLPARQDWDHSVYFFSTYENDMFLSMLEDEEEDPLDQLSYQMGKGFSLEARPDSPDSKPSAKYIKLDDCLQISDHP